MTAPIYHPPHRPLVGRGDRRGAAVLGAVRCAGGGVMRAARCTGCGHRGTIRDDAGRGLTCGCAMLPESRPRTVAALYVQTGGAYYGLPGVDPWDQVRDARLYAGPHPVVAHPPCARWSRLAGFAHSRGAPAPGDDGGCFAAALASVRRWGGVLEHPEASAAWAAHGLIAPPSSGGWVTAGDWTGWTCRVEQGHYGHPSAKPTWLYAVGVDLPSLCWGESAAEEYASESPKRGHSKRKPVELMSRADRIVTPPAFRDLLLAMARTVRVRSEAA